MTTFYANPYNLDAAGFYFAAAGEFIEKMEALTDRWGAPVEEFEIDFVDGDDFALFSACGIDQGNLERWFDEIEPLGDREKVALAWLVGEAGYTLDDALGKIDDVSLARGQLLDAATELFDDCYLDSVPENVRNYIDYEAFARDCECGGDMSEFEYMGETWTITNASGI
ncbi:MAG: antirestriction protein ArdA [Sulfurisoma sp.]|nr:antirestriction protein ArdA [Sulfurisoma sp.]